LKLHLHECLIRLGATLLPTFHPGSGKRHLVISRRLVLFPAESLSGKPPVFVFLAEPLWWPPRLLPLQELLSGLRNVRKVCSLLVSPLFPHEAFFFPTTFAGRVIEPNIFYLQSLSRGGTSGAHQTGLYFTSFLFCVFFFPPFYARFHYTPQFETVFLVGPPFYSCKLKNDSFEPFNLDQSPLNHSKPHLQNSNERCKFPILSGGPLSIERVDPFSLLSSPPKNETRPVSQFHEERTSGSFATSHFL